MGYLAENETLSNTLEESVSLLIGLNTGEEDYDSNMQELKALARACDYEVAGMMVQSLAHPVCDTYIGHGKIDEICEAVSNLDISVCIFEDTLSPVQLKNLSKLIPCKIMDRTGLILEIFSKRARTREAKLQVESAKLQYMLPRLIGMWEAIGRQGGGSGSTSNKGVGETQLELDRRWIQKRMSELRRELEQIEHDRDIQRRKRERGQLPLVALVGYTNAGKSTIMNHLLAISSAKSEAKQVFEKDMLFATLDTSIRRIDCADRKSFLLSDTVGFLDKLPHGLIQAFRSTLDEIKYADLLLEVVDISDPKHIEQMKVTEDTLRELNASNIPCIRVMNKCDCFEEAIDYPRIDRDTIFISAGSNVGITELVALIKQTVYKDNEELEVLIPYECGNLVNLLNENATVLVQDYRADGVYIKADMPSAMVAKFSDYRIQ